jgi:hypothetical protein
MAPHRARVKVLAEFTVADSFHPWLSVARRCRDVQAARLYPSAKHQ